MLTAVSCFDRQVRAHLKSESQDGSLGDILKKQDPGHAGEELSSPTDAADATHR